MTVTSSAPISVRTPDGRTLDVYVEGPVDGLTLLFHLGTPSAPLPYRPVLDEMAARDTLVASASPR